jgi:tRNA(fMet)-specific endonuclease VapC
LALLIDTSLFITIERTGQRPDALLEQFGEEPVAIAAITASELLHGVHRANTGLRRRRREHFVGIILRSVLVLPFTLETARIHARIWADLVKRGTIIGAHDVLIAATALTHDLTLVTGNVRHFERVELLRLSVW